MILTKDEQKSIGLIKRDFNTRHNWSKRDYSDFYFRDVSLLLGIVNRYASDKPDAERQRGLV